MLKKIDKSLCNGCTSCKSACPIQCILMKEDDDGFKYPIIDKNKCINCNICENVCPILHKHTVNKETVAYAVINKNEDIRLNSSSGGFFTILSEFILKKDGYIVGAAYNDDFRVHHIIINNSKELHKIRGAKYSQSDLDNIFIEVKELLDNNSWVLFSGTPCQVGGLKSFLRKEYKRLITVDLVCHGVPSPKVWMNYVKYRSDVDNKGKLPKSINLRSKISGWSRYAYSIVFNYDEKKYSSLNVNDLFMKLFVGNYCLRESCSNCSFKGIHRESDFTLGDYWGIWEQLPEMDDNKGTSLVLVHGEKAKKIFYQINQDIIFEQVDSKKSVTYNSSIIYSSQTHACREELLSEITSQNFKNVAEKFMLKSNVSRNSFKKIINLLNSILNK